MTTDVQEILDDALIRPGRFYRAIEVPLPDEEGRKSCSSDAGRRYGLLVRVHLKGAFAPDIKGWLPYLPLVKKYIIYAFKSKQKISANTFIANINV